jgi:hypothetical protein
MSFRKVSRDSARHTTKNHSFVVEKVTAEKILQIPVITTNFDENIYDEVLKLATGPGQMFLHTRAGDSVVYMSDYNDYPLDTNLKLNKIFES